MFKFLKLLKRIKSLEEYLGVIYSPGDLKDDYAQHVSGDFGVMRRVDKLETKIDNLSKK